MYCNFYNSPIGKIIMASADHMMLDGLWFENQKHMPDTTGWTADRNPLFDATTRWLDAYFSQKNTAEAVNVPPPPIRMRGTEFQKRVWRALSHIPWGKTLTYGELAKTVACPCPQAVGNAVGRNPVSILIPCHRIVGASGSLTGYAGGLERKLWLLKHENSR